MMNHFDRKARERERWFLKRVNEGYTFKTGNGHENFVVEVTPKVIYFCTTRSKRPFAIPRAKFRQAIARLFYVRTTTRKELEKHSVFSSTLMGIMQLVFSGISKIHRTVRGLLRITLKGVRHYFCGLARASEDDWTLVQSNGATMILLSYWELRNDKDGGWRKRLIEHGLSALIDSGEFSRYSAEQKGIPYEPLRVEEYAIWLKQNHDVIAGYLNLDKIHDAETSARNYRYLTEQGLQPIPVWQCQSSWEGLERLIREDHPVIAIGGTKFITRADRHTLFTELFRRYPNQAFHGLGVASPYVGVYPWFSVDSSSWLAGRQFGRLVTPFRQYVAPDDWSSKENLAFNIRQLAELEDNYTGTYQVDLLAQPGTRHKARGGQRGAKQDNQLSLFDLDDLVG